MWPDARMSRAAVSVEGARLGGSVAVVEPKADKPLLGVV